MKICGLIFNKKDLKMRLIYILLIDIFLLGNVLGQTTQTSVTKGSDNGFFSKKRWGASYFNYMNGPTFSENEGEYSIDHYLSLKHKFNSDWNLTGVFTPNQKIGKKDSDEKTFTQGDSYLKLGLPGIYNGRNGTKIFSQLRYYAPLSESSKRRDINGKLSPRIYVTTSFGNLQFIYALISKIYLNKKSKNGQALFSHGHWFQGNYKVSEKFTLDFAIYPSWSYSRNEDSRFNDIPIYPGFTYTMNKRFSLSTFIEWISLNRESRSTTLTSSLSYAIF